MSCMLKIRKKIGAQNNIVNKIDLTGDVLLSKLVLLVASLCDGITTIKNLSCAKEIKNLENILQEFGIKVIKNDNNTTLINGLNIKKWKQPNNFINIKSSIDILFYLLNILSKTNFRTFITANEDILDINFDNLSYLESDNNLIFKDKYKLPLLVNGTSNFKKNKIEVDNTLDKYSIIFNLIAYNNSCIINEHELKEEYLEIIIKYFGFNIKEKLSETRNILNKNCKKNKEISILKNNDVIKGKDFFVPISHLEATYIIFLITIMNVEELIIPNVSLNELNPDIIKTFIDNGINITYKNQRIINGIKALDLHFKTSILNEFSVSEKRLSNIIEELPLVVMLNVLKKNKVNITGIKELKLKNNKNYVEFLKILRLLNISAIENKNILEINPESLTIPNEPILLDNIKDIDNKTKLILFLSNIALSKNIFELNDKEVLDVFPNIHKILEQLNLEIE